MMHYFAPRHLCLSMLVVRLWPHLCQRCTFEPLPFSLYLEVLLRISLRYLNTFTTPTSSLPSLDHSLFVVSFSLHNTRVFLFSSVPIFLRSCLSSSLCPWAFQIASSHLSQPVNPLSHTLCLSSCSPCRFSSLALLLLFALEIFSPQAAIYLFSASLTLLCKLFSLHLPCV